MRVYWNLDKHIVWSGFLHSHLFIDINMKQSYFFSFYWLNYPYVTSVRYCKKGEK